MSSLVPKKLPDKNGRIVTRYVKDDLPFWTRAAFVPPVKPINAKRLRQDIAKSLLRPADDRIINQIPSESLSPLARFVAKHSYADMGDDLLDGAVLIDPPQFKKCLRILDRHHDTASSILAQATKDTLELRSHESMLVTGMLRHEFKMTIDQQKTLISAICRIWITDLDDLDQLDALFPSFKSDQKLMTIGGTTMQEELAKLIAYTPEKTDLIVSFITERGITDAKAISELLESSPSAALGEGAL